MASQGASILQEWRLMAQAHFATVLHGLSFPTTLANVRSDCAGENTSAAFLRWCKDTGIHAENSAPYSQWQDGRAEINIKTAWAGSEAMRKHSSSPPEHWPLTLEAFVTTRNLMPKRVGLSPWERWWNVTKPFKERIAHLRTYGCACWALVPKELRKKLDGKASFGIFVGYSPTSKAYRILDPQSGRVGVATSVVFDETVMPFVVAGRKMADSLDKFSFPTMLLNCSPPVVCADDPGDTPATVGDGAPSAVNCDSTPAPEVPAPEVSAVDDIAMLPTLEPPVIECDTVVAADTVSPASVLDGVHTTAPGEFRRSARIRDLSHATTNTLVPTAPSPSLPVVSPSTPPVVASPGQSWAVQSIVGYQLRRERDEYGTPAAHLTDHYRVRWVGDWDDTWESAACLSGAQETVDAYNASHMSGMRTARARAEAIERGDVVTDPVSCTSVDEQKHDGVHLQVKSLVAACTSSAVLPDDTLDLDDVISQLPPFACSAVALSAISRRLDEGVDSHTLSRIRRRLDIIALAMTATPAPLVGCPPNVGVALAHAGWRKSV